ncbi:MAG: hypothetical protein IJ461_03785 [Clostridia bacterium]|nr:hypothetical protein [Clostridia bacterium]
MMIDRRTILYAVVKGLMMCLLLFPVTVLAEEAFVVLTSYEEYPVWQEAFEDPRELIYDQEHYYSFSVPGDWVQSTNEEHYQLFSDMSWIDAGRLLREQKKGESAGLVSYWVRLQLHVPQGYRVGVENFRFKNATDDVWVKMVLEEMDSVLGYEWIREDPLGLANGEYHLRMMARKGVDLKEAIEKAELLCDVTWHPGTEKAFTATIQVLSPYLAEQSYDQPVQVEVLNARQVPDERVMGQIRDTEEFWDNMTPYHYLLYMDDYDLWEVTARITKEGDCPLVNLRWKGTGVGGSWLNFGGEYIYDQELDLAPEETQVEATFYVVSLQGSTQERQLNYLRSEEVWLEYATEYVGIFDYLYTPGPKYQVKVDMSKVELTE